MQGTGKKLQNASYESTDSKWYLRDHTFHEK